MLDFIFNYFDKLNYDINILCFILYIIICILIFTYINIPSVSIIELLII